MGTAAHGCSSSEARLAFSREALSNSTHGRIHHKALSWPAQWNQTNAVILPMAQGPQRRTGIAEPVVLHLPRLLPRPNKRRCNRLAGFGQAVGLDQEKFSIPEFKKRAATLRIGTSAEHVFDSRRRIELR